MQSNVLTAVLMPLALGVIMLGLGLSLTTDDFKRVIVYPRAVVVGLLCQMGILPVVCFFVARGFDLSPELAVGLMLLAASPGGATANLFSHLAKGDVALNITLTAVNSVLSLVTLPLIVNYSLEHFIGEGKSIPLQFSKVIQVVAVVMIPVASCMRICWRTKEYACRLDRPVRIVSAAFLLAVILSALFKERSNDCGSPADVRLAALAFNVASLLVGYVVPRLFRVDRKQA